MDSVRAVSHAAPEYALQGYVSTPPAGYKHKQKQYLYINNRCVHSGQAGKQINSLYRAIMLRLQPSTDSAQSRHQRQTASMFPAFALQLSCPAQTHSISRDADKMRVEFADWTAVSKVFATAIVKAWSAVASSKMLAEALGDIIHEGVHVKRSCNTIRPSSTGFQRHQQASAAEPTVSAAALPTAMQKYQHPLQAADYNDAEQDVCFSTSLPAAAMNSTRNKIASIECAQQTERNSTYADSQPAAIDADGKHGRLGFLPKLQSSVKIRIPIKSLQEDQASLQLALCL